MSREEMAFCVPKKLAIIAASWDTLAEKELMQ